MQTVKHRPAVNEVNGSRKASKKQGTKYALNEVKARRKPSTHKEQYAAKIETLRRKEVRKMKTSWA